jgi:uncharacterized Fe-S cluster protein YjdI
MAKRTYTNGEINILWDSSLCTHCGECEEGLPDVFNPTARPWVNMKGGTTEDIREQVEQCPSGALTVEDAKSDKPVTGQRSVYPLTQTQQAIDAEKQRIRENFGGVD